MRWLPGASTVRRSCEGPPVRSQVVPGLPSQRTLKSAAYDPEDTESVRAVSSSAPTMTLSDFAGPPASGVSDATTVQLYRVHWWG